MTDIADREWRLIREERRPGPMQMALDEVAAETAAEGGPRTVRLYRWDPSTLSAGYRQSADSIDWTYCRKEGITVTRRQTGGGGIYHDVDGDISYSIIAPAEELPGDLMESYEMLCGPILSGFERMGIDADFAESEQPAIYQPACYLRAISPAHDILAGGQKISGNAQYRQRNAVIQHGSLSYSRTTARHLGVFETTEIGPEQFERRVTSIREQAGIERSTAVDALETALAEWADAEGGTWTDEEIERAREIAAEKYDTEAWNRNRTDPLAE
jgi:lipoate-protein ligase A